jgi:hypothetical protein
VPEGAAEVKIPAWKISGQGKFGHRFRGKVVLRADNCAGYEGGKERVSQRAGIARGKY